MRFLESFFFSQYSLFRWLGEGPLALPPWVLASLRGSGEAAEERAGAGVDAGFLPCSRQAPCDLNLRSVSSLDIVIPGLNSSTDVQARIHAGESIHIIRGTKGERPLGPSRPGNGVCVLGPCWSMQEAWDNDIPGAQWGGDRPKGYVSGSKGGVRVPTFLCSNVVLMENSGWVWIGPVFWVRLSLWKVSSECLTHLVPSCLWEPAWAFPQSQSCGPAAPVGVTMAPHVRHLCRCRLSAPGPWRASLCPGAGPGSRGRERKSTRPGLRLSPHPRLGSVFISRLTTHGAGGMTQK